MAYSPLGGRNAGGPGHFLPLSPTAARECEAPDAPGCPLPQGNPTAERAPAATSDEVLG